ncbi:MAG TPA: sulfotransferase [Anaerolineales bacterium]|nr:sulfotransferase [Anaerolineales bacterium]
MSESTIPVFVVGSGRSGTRTIFKLLSGIQHVEIHHEFVCTHIQKVAAQHFMGITGRDEAKREIMELHGSAIHYSKSKIWTDCSNKLSWLIGPLYDLFPNARFIHLARDGRKVASSYFHKLNDEMYDDESVAIMRDWLLDREHKPVPPPEKKYWWNIPQPGQPFAEEFPKFDQFQRACYQWREANRVIWESLKNIPAEQKMFVKLEDLVSSKSALETFLGFFEVGYEDHYAEYLKTPQNVIFPMDFMLTDEQNAQFKEIALDVMQLLGYSNMEEYTVDYGTQPKNV